MNYYQNNRSYTFLRYPPTKDRSLRPLSAADELLLDWRDHYLGGSQVAAETLDSKGVVILHDRFGVLATVLSEHRPQFVISYASQQKALIQQLEKNKVDAKIIQTRTPLEELTPTNLGLLRIPKSLELFEVYLAQFARMASQREGSPVLLAGFMTRHFTPALLKIAERYASDVSQTKARKKARLLRIADFRTDAPSPRDLMKSISFNGFEYQQYYGVFSASHIDYATQFLLAYLKETPAIISENDTSQASVLDLACGNGVIGRELLNGRGDRFKLTAIEDFYLATLSAQLNLVDTESDVIWSDAITESNTETYDLVVSNPPFHFGYENSTEVAVRLFGQVTKVLKPAGKLILVGNRHLNYSTHLRQLYGVVEQLSSNDKFEVLLAEQPLKGS